jgi:hypothetical protein
VTGVIVVHPSPTDLRATYAGLHGDAAVRLDRDRLIVKLGDDTISLLAPKAFKSRFPTIPIPEDLSQGWFAGATLRVRSLDKVAQILSQVGVAAARAPSGALLIAPSEAASTLLEFQAA